MNAVRRDTAQLYISKDRPVGWPLAADATDQGFISKI